MDWYHKSRHIVMAKDAPLNLRGWRQRWAAYFKWAKNALSSARDGDVRSAMVEFARIVSSAYDEDRYYLSQTEHGSMWDDPEYLFGKIDTYLGTLESVDFYLGDGNAQKALASMRYLPDYVESIRYFQMGFTEARNATWKTLRENVGESGPLTAADMDSLARSSRVVAKWFRDFTNIERARKSIAEDLETLVEWKGRGGPTDRTQIDRLYHATVSAPQIEAEGFKVNTETKGLGGATDDMISTTLSKRIAMSIADSLKRIIALSNGSANCTTILKWARKAGVLDQMTEWGEGGMSGIGILLRLIRDVGEAEALRMIDAGYAPRFPYGMEAPTVDKLPEGGIPIKVERVGTRDVVRSYWVEDQRENDELLMGIFRTYLAAVESSGKGYDPLFFGVDLENFRGLDPKSVGVFELDVDMEDPRIKYVEGMYEYRVPVGSIKSVHRIL